MDMRVRTFNSPIVIGVADQDRGHPGGARGLHIERGITHVPDRWIGRPPELRQSEMDRRRIGLVGGRVARTDH